jgi:hypothetical protein
MYSYGPNGCVQPSQNATPLEFLVHDAVAQAPRGNHGVEYDGALADRPLRLRGSYLAG